MTEDFVTTGDKLQNAFVYFKSVDPLTQYAFKIIVWHEKLGEQEMEITLAPFEVRNVDFVFGRESY